MFAIRLITEFSTARNFFIAQLVGLFGTEAFMSDTEDDWPKDYNSKLRRHLHAVGVISLRFSQFEAALHDLYIRLKSSHGQKLEDIEEQFSKLNDEKRAKAIRRAGRSFTHDMSMGDKVANLLDYFDWCREVGTLFFIPSGIPNRLAETTSFT